MATVVCSIFNNNSISQSSFSWADEMEREDELILQTIATSQPTTSRIAGIVPSAQHVAPSPSKPTHVRTPSYIAPTIIEVVVPSMPKKETVVVETKPVSLVEPPVKTMNKKQRAAARRLAKQQPQQQTVVAATTINTEGCELFVGGVVFTDLEKIISDRRNSFKAPGAASKNQKGSHRRRCISESEAERLQRVEREENEDTELIQQYKDRRIRCLMEILEEFGTVRKLTPRWQRRHAHVLFDNKESARKAFETMADPASRKLIFERMRQRLREEGLPAELVPTRFYLRESEKDTTPKSPISTNSRIAAH